jgi:hypothetical protein
MSHALASLVRTQAFKEKKTNLCMLVLVNKDLRSCFAFWVDILGKRTWNRLLEAGPIE